MHNFLLIQLRSLSCGGVIGAVEVVVNGVDVVGVVVVDGFVVGDDGGVGVAGVVDVGVEVGVVVVVGAVVEVEAVVLVLGFVFGVFTVVFGAALGVTGLAFLCVVFAFVRRVFLRRIAAFVFVVLRCTVCL